MGKEVAYKGAKKALKRPVRAGGKNADYSWASELVNNIMGPSSYDNGASPGYRHDRQEDLMDLWEAVDLISVAEPQERGECVRYFEETVARIVRKKQRSCHCSDDGEEYELALYPVGAKPPQGPHNPCHPNI